MQTPKADNYVQDSMRNFRAQCFYGIQTMPYKVEQTSDVDRGNQVVTNHIDKHDSKASIALSEGISLTKPKKKENKVSPTKSLWEAALPPDDEDVQLDWAPTGRKNFHHNHSPSDHMDLYITTLNDADVGFKLDTCKLQKHHERYGEGQSCDEELILIDEEPLYKKKFGEGKEFKQALETAQKWQKKYNTASEIPDIEIPQ